MAKRSKFMKKHGKATILIVAFLLVFASYFVVNELFAAPAPNVFNGISSATPGSPGIDTATWGPNFGWVSLNCDDPLANINSCDTANYGVYLETDENSASFGYLTGSGWSNHLGWVTFDQNVNPPAVPAAQGASYCGPQARMSGSMNDANLAFSGYGRAIVAPTDINEYWDGCINMDGVNFSPVTGDITGSAWGSFNIGWLHFAAHVVVDNQPTVILDANPNPITSGTNTDLTWTANAEVVSCEAIPNGDPNWTAQTPLSVPTGTIPTSNLTSNTTYEILCENAFGDQVSDSVLVEINQYPIYLTAFPTVVYPDPNNPGDFGTTQLEWGSEQSYPNCQLKTYDQNQQLQIVSPQFAITAYQVGSSANHPVDYLETTYRIDCSSPNIASSNPVTVYQDIPVTTLHLSAGCVEEEGDPSWIYWYIQNLNQCSITGPISGALTTNSATVNAPFGTYQITCTNPATNQTETTGPVSMTVGGTCSPPGTPDPDIIFEEF